MNYTGLILRSSLRSKRRSFLTAASVGVSVFILVTLLTLVRELTVPIETDASVRRLVTRHRAGLTNPLPRRYLDTIKQMPEIENVIPLTWFGGVYIDESHFFPRFAVDQDHVFEAIPERKIDPAVLEVFKRQRDACVVGDSLLEKEGIKVGDRIRIQGDIYPVELDMQIVGSMRLDLEGLDGKDPTLFFRHDYLDDLLGNSDMVGTIWCIARDEKRIPEICEKIDARFANTEAETKTQTEKQFGLSFISMIGNVKLLIGSVCIVVVIALFMVVAGTIAMTIRERTREIAVLKTIGMTRRLVFTLLVGESVLISLLGGLAGLGVATALYRNVDMLKLSGGMLFKFDVTSSNAALCTFVAVFVGLLSAIFPSISATRKTVIEGLRSVE